jgi:hypothetical protein
MHSIKPIGAFLLSTAMIQLTGCASTWHKLSAQDVADIQAQVPEASRRSILSIDASGEYVEAYAANKIVYLFKRDKAGRLVGCGAGDWD